VIDAHVALVALLLLALLLASLAIALAVLIRLPENYLGASGAAHSQRARHGPAYWVCFVPKTLLGVVLVVVGIVIPIPGEGLLTVFAGLSLLEFPGKRRLLTKALGRPAVLRSINRLRASFSRSPLIVG
jgi:hypothetical protein